MQGTINPEVLPKVEAEADNLEEMVKVKFPRANETLEDLTRQTGGEQPMKDAKAFATALTAFGGMLLDFVGETGDRSTDKNTIRAYTTSQRKLIAAMGGN